MAYTQDQIIEIAQRSGIPFKVSSTLRPGAKTKSGKTSHHAHGQAVDFGGFNQDQLAKLFMGIPTLEVFHLSEETGQWYGSSRGKPVDPETHRQLVDDHRNHLHVAMAEEHVGPGSFLDQLRKGLANIMAPSDGSGAPSGALGALARYIPTPGSITEAIGNVGQGVYAMAQSLGNVGFLAQKLTQLLLPTNLLRGAAFFFGIIWILIGIWFLSREIRESKA